MSMEVSAHYRSRWDTQVRLRLQSKGNMLEGTVMPPMRWDVHADQTERFYFLRSGKLNTSKWPGRGHAVTRQGSSDDTVAAASEQWDCAFELYDKDKWATAAGEEQTRQNQASNAIGRTADSIIYEKIMAATIPTENVIGDYSKGLDPYMLLEAEAKLFEQFTPNDGGIYFPCPARQFQRLSTFKISASSDWIGGDLPLTKRTKARTYGNINLFQGEQDLFTPYIASTELRVRIWHKECVGAGYSGERLKTEWKREAEYKRWLVIHTIDGGAEVIEPNGIVELRLKADALIEPEVQKTQAIS